eukprot:889_1
MAKVTDDERKEVRRNSNPQDKTTKAQNPNTLCIDTSTSATIKSKSAPSSPGLIITGGNGKSDSAKASAATVDRTNASEPASPRASQEVGRRKSSGDAPTGDGGSKFPAPREGSRLARIDAVETVRNAWDVVEAHRSRCSDENNFREEMYCQEAFHEFNDDAETKLAIFGPRFSILDAEKLINLKIIEFCYVNFNKIAEHFIVLRKLPNLTTLEFS